MNKAVTGSRAGARLGLLLWAAILVSPPTLALDFSYSGFGSFIAGDILGGSHGTYLNYQCPCYIGSWEYAGIYQDKGWTASPESLLGVQGRVALWGPLSATAQLVARSSTEKLTPDWFYLDYRLTPSWNLQAGRQRTPLYSDSAYIGYTYPWVRPPPEVYGWEIYDFDGGSLTYRHELGDWSLRSNAYAGRRSTSNNVMQSRLVYGDRVDEAWNKILGGYVELTNDIISARVLYQHNKIDQYEYPDGVHAIQIAHRSPQDVIALAFSADYRNFLLRTEANTLKRSQEDLDVFTYLFGGGYRFHQVTGMLTHSWYYERHTTGDSDLQRFHTDTATLRWDFHKSWDAKIQFDAFHDYSRYAFLGDSRLLTVAIDTVF